MLRAVLLTFVLFLAACGGGRTGEASGPVLPSGADEDGQTSAADPTSACTATPDLPGGGTVLAGTAAGDDIAFPWNRDDAEVLPGFDADRVISGGPPPDGIRPIDAPCFESVETAADWLTDEDPVMVIEVAGDVRAYPLSIMTQHEIANDVVGGEPVIVTYCPLCNSGLAFERTVDGDVLDFGTSGRLFQSNLVMYDRQTRGLWTQFDGQAVIGEPYVGTELVQIPTSVLGFSELADLAPDAMVLSRDVFPDRDYGRNPYPGYDDRGIGFGLFDGDTDDRLPPNTRVVGLGDDDAAVAVPLDRLMAEGVVTTDVGGDEVVILWAPGAASALDAATVRDGRDVGQTAAFRPEVDGQTLTLSPADEDGTFVDQETSTTWDLLGRGIEGELAGSRLEPVSHEDTFWFVWFAFRPATTVATGG